MVTNKVSQNLHAELLLHHLGKRAMPAVMGRRWQGARLVRAFLVGKAGLIRMILCFMTGRG